MLSSNTTNTNTQFLTIKEQQWLKSKKEPLKIGITKIPNQVLKNNKSFNGYSIDLFNEIENVLNIKFKYIYYDTWNQVLEAGKKREIDIVFLAQKTEKRLEIYNFTDIVLVQHNKILTLNENSDELDVEDIYNKKVAIVKHSAIEEYIRLNFPKINVVKSSSETDSLSMLLEHKVDCTIAEPVRISYYIKQNNLDNIHISGTFPYDYKLRIATRNDKPIINIILNKALDNISIAEKKSLLLKWGYEKEVFLINNFL